MSPFPATWVAGLHQVLSEHVERGDLPGLVALVAHGGATHVDVIGTRAFGDPAPLPRDAIFRIASLSKPISAVAAMTLVDDGTLALDEPVDALLPELAARRVLRRIDADLDDTVPATRPITVEDLLTFRLGFGNVMAPPAATYPIQLAEEHLQLATLGPPWPPPPLTPDEWIARLGTLPLMHQPGEAWRYNTGSQVLGVLLERATGMPLEALLRERLFDPLGMPDTAFSFTPAQRDRMTTAYVPDPDTGAPVLLDDIDESWWGRPPTMPNAAAGLVSTIDDLWAFAQLFLDGGVHRARRIISEASLALMTTDHLTPSQRAGGSPILGAHDSWGLGLAVPAAGGDRAHLPGGFGWIGGSGTTWRTDPDRDLTGILLTQRGLSSPQPPPLFDDFWRAAYAVLDV